MRFGEIYAVEFPISDGHEQMGIRPAIVVQSEKDQERLPTILIVPLTSRMKAANFPFTFSIMPDSENQLRMPSVALTFQLRVIDKKRIKNRFILMNSLTSQVNFSDCIMQGRLGKLGRLGKKNEIFSPASLASPAPHRFLTANKHCPLLWIVV